MSDKSIGEVDKLEALARLPTQAHPIASPNGDQIALYYDITGRNELYVVDLETGELEQWSSGDVPRNTMWFVRWGTGGDRIYFHQDNAGNEQNDIYAIDESGAIEPVFEQEGHSILLDVTDDFLIVGSTQGGQLNLYRNDIATGNSSQVTDYARAVTAATVSPSRDLLAYSTNETNDFDNKDVYIAGVDGSDPTNLEIGKVGAEALPVDWGPHSRCLLVSDNSTDFGRIGIYDLDDEEIEWYGDADCDESPVALISAPETEKTASPN